MAGCKNQLNMKYHGKLLVSNIYHIEIITCSRKFTIVNILGGNLYQKIYTTTSTHKVSIKFWQNINEELLKTEYLIILSQYFGNFTQEFLLCDVITAFARFPKYWLSLARYATLKSPSSMFCQHLIETL